MQEGRKTEYIGKDPAEFGFKDIIYEKKDMVAKVTLNRPQVFNAYSLNTLKEVAEAFLDITNDDAVGVVVFTGAGEKAFCTGGDVKEYAENYTHRPRDFWKWMGFFNRSHDLMRNCGKPIIARVNGMVAGGGNEFHMSCDLSIAAEHVKIRQVGTKVGSVAAGGATQFLPIFIGDRRAREMLFLCDWIDAKTCMQWGLINKVVPYAELDKAVDEWCQNLLEKFPECTRYTKQQVNFWKDLSWNMTIGHARDWLSVHFATIEPQEGMWSFVEKRPTDYKGIRKKMAEGKGVEFPWGANRKSCAKCGAKWLPEDFEHCGKCGAKL